MTDEQNEMWMRLQRSAKANRLIDQVRTQPQTPLTPEQVKALCDRLGIAHIGSRR